MKPKNFAVLYFFFYILMGIFKPYIFLFYKHLNFTGTQMGIIGIIAPIIIITTLNLWGILADLKKGYKKILIFLFVMSGITILLHLKAYTIFSILLITIIFNFFFTAIGPLLDAGALKKDKQDNYIFGKIRMWGSLGFCIAVLLSGYLIKIFNIYIIFKVYFVVMIISVFYIVFKTKEKKSDIVKQTSKTEFKNDIKKMIFKKDIILFSIGILIVFSTINGNFILYSLYFKEYIGNEDLLGWSWLIGASIEILIFPLTRRILKKYSTTMILIITTIILSLRWYFYSLFQNLYIVLLLQVLHGIIFAFFTIGSIYFLREHSTEKIGNSTQTFLSTLMYGIAGIIGNLMIGILMDIYELKYCYFIMFILNSTAIIIFVILKFTYNKSY